jgi:hypothetical protein
LPSIARRGFPTSTTASAATAARRGKLKASTRGEEDD